MTGVLFAVALTFTAPSVAQDPGDTLSPKKEQEKPAEELYQDAWYQQNALREFDKAIPLYQKIVDAHRDREELAARALLRLGECYEALGKTDEAVRCYEEARTLYARQVQVAKEAAEKLKAIAKKRDAIPKEMNAVFVEHLLAEGPKERLQFRAGDILLEYDGKPVTGLAELEHWTSDTSGAATVGMKLRRRGSDLTLTAPGGPLGAQLRQSHGTGNPPLMDTRNYQDLLLTLQIESEPERAEFLDKLARRKNLTVLEQAAILDSVYGHLSDRACREDVRETLMRNPSFSQEARSHLTARLESIQHSVEKRDIIHDLFDLKRGFKPSVNSGDGPFSRFGAGWKTWDGRFKVNSQARSGSSHHADGDGTGIVFVLGGLNDDQSIGYRYRAMEGTSRLRAPLRFRGGEFPAGARVEERVTLHDFSPPSLPVLYRRIEIEIKNSSTRKDKTYDLFLFGPVGSDVAYEWTWHPSEEKDPWSLHCSWGFGVGDLSFKRFASILEMFPNVEYQASKDLSFHLGYGFEYFYLRGQGSLIENIQHGPSAGLTYRW